MNSSGLQIRIVLVLFRMFQRYGCLFLLIIGTAAYNQSDYVLVPERMILVSFNQKYLNATIKNFKYNRTAIAANITYNIKRDYGNDLKVDVQAYKFASNEYRQFPLTFTENVCAILNRNDFGLENIYKCGKGARCPLMKGNYYFCNWAPDYKKWPPYIPVGQYRLDLTFVYSSEEVAYVQYFLIVKGAKWGNW